MIKYIGSKRLLVPTIERIAACLPGVETVLDLFSGTSRVGHALKRAGYRVTANDHNAYAHALGRCYVEADRDALVDEVRERVGVLNGLPGRAGYFTETFCERSRYLQAKNGMRIDAMRAQIAAWKLPPVTEAVLLVSLMEAADRVDSTCGLQMAFLKRWSARSNNDIELRVPDMLAGGGRAWCLDAADAAAREPFDLVYVDPPYNQHRYLGNYHVWETLVRGDEPDVYGTACKRVDCREYKSPFNSKRQIRAAVEQTLGALCARYLLVSFNDEGYLPHDELFEMLGARGEVASLAVDYKRYVGAQIGIHNPRGERVGRVSHLRNQEFLFLVGEGATEIVGRLGGSAQTAPVPAAQ